MKTQTQIIAFKKSSVLELDNNKMNDVKGGSLSPFMPSSIIVIAKEIED